VTAPTSSRSTWMSAQNPSDRNPHLRGCRFLLGIVSTKMAQLRRSRLLPHHVVRHHVSRLVRIILKWRHAPDQRVAPHAIAHRVQADAAALSFVFEYIAEDPIVPFAPRDDVHVIRGTVS